MDSILSDRNEDDDATGIFGKACLIYKFHGSVPHAQRHNMMKRLKAMIRSRCALLLGTDAAARGLNILHENRDPRRP